VVVIDKELEHVLDLSNREAPTESVHGNLVDMVAEKGLELTISLKTDNVGLERVDVLEAEHYGVRVSAKPPSGRELRVQYKKK